MPSSQKDGSFFGKQVYMQKFFRFLKSMTFGLILLGIIVIFSVIGSVVPQSQNAMTYVRQFPSFYKIILTCGFDHIFTTWYFIAVTAMLCVNLILCSIIRFRTVVNQKIQTERAAAVPTAVETDEKQRDAVIRALEREHCHRETFAEGTEVYYKNSFGRFGTFFTHLGILLTVVFWAMAMYLPKILDETCYPGESIRLEDGTEIQVDSFSIETDAKLDYKSVINIKLPDGRESGLKEVSVNHPVKMGQYKVYQQTYGTIGHVTVTNEAGASDSFYLETNDLLSADGKNGILYDNLYPDFTEENGQMQVISSTSGSYKNPVYVYTVVEDGQQTEVMLAFPGDVQEIGTFSIHFDDPVEYPGLRIKRSPSWVNICLLLSFMVMTAGLFMTFMMQPVLVTVKKDGYTVQGRQERMRIILNDAVHSTEGEEHHNA